MKTQFFTLFFTIICLSLQAQQPCIIEGNINGIPDGTVISLMRQQGTGMKRIANDTIDNGKFKFIIHTLNNQTEALRIVSKGEGFPNTWLDVYASPGETVSIIGSDKLLRTWNIVSNIKEQQEENQYTNEGFRNLTDQRQRLQALSSDMWKKIAISDSPKEKISNDGQHPKYTVSPTRLPRAVTVQRRNQFNEESSCYLYLARSFGSIKPSICLSKRLSYLRSSSIVSATNINTTQLTNRKKDRSLFNAYKS